jgi:hypothetical protein
MKFEFSRQIFQKQPDIKFNGHASGGGRVVPCEQMDRRTDMTKVMFGFLNSANAPRNFVIKSFQLNQPMNFTGEQPQTVCTLPLTVLAPFTKAG